MWDNSTSSVFVEGKGWCVLYRRWISKLLPSADADQYICQHFQVDNITTLLNITPQSNIAQMQYNIFKWTNGPLFLDNQDLLMTLVQCTSSQVIITPSCEDMHHYTIPWWKSRDLWKLNKASKPLIELLIYQARSDK